MNEFTFLLPEESVDCNLYQVANLRKIENTLRAVFEEENYQEVMLPSLEYTNLYTNIDTSLQQENMFQFINHEGKSISMRFDFTIPLARLYATRYHANKQSVKYSYFGKVYRKQKHYKGRKTEIYQAGIELLNHEVAQGDVDIIKLIQNTKKELPVEDMLIEIGYAPFFNRLVELVGNKEYFIQLCKYRDISGIQKFVENQIENKALQELLLFLPISFGKLSLIKEYVLNLNDNILNECIEYLTTIQEVICEDVQICFDLSMVPEMNYYTGIMIKGYIKGCNDTIITGGRYDKLLEKFNVKASAIGFCYNLDKIAQMVEQGAMQ